MTDPIRISIIIPAFNDQAGILACLRGIDEQSYPAGAVEVLVVDNASTPPLSLEGVPSTNVRLIRCLQPGSYAARNRGVSEAKGEVLVFIDADCWPAGDWLRQGVDSLVSHGGSRIVGGEVTIVKPCKPTATALYQQTTGFGQERNVNDRGFSATANLFCTRRQFDTVGPFDTRLLSGGDREWCWRAHEHGFDVLFEPRALVYTHPRTDLRSAIRQARRVVAGRKMLLKFGLAHIGSHAIAKLRSPWRATSWILTCRELSVWDRLRVLCVAMLIHMASILERIRLAMGTPAERR